MAISGRPLGSMIVELDMQSTKFENSLKSIQNQFRLAKSEMKANLSVLDKTGTSYEKSSKEVEELSKVMEVNEKRIQEMNEKYQTSVKTSGEYSDATVKAASQLNKAEAQQAQYQRQLENAKVAAKEASRGIDQYTESLKRVRNQSKIQVDSLTTQGRNTEANVVKYRALSKEIDNYESIITSEKAKLQDLIATKGADSKQTLDQKAKIEELTAVQEKTKYQYDELGKKVKNFSTNQAQSIDKLDKLSGKFHEVGGKIKDVGSSMSMKFTLPIVAGLGYASKAANDYQYQLQDIRKEVDAQGYSTSQVNKIMIDLSKDTLSWSQKFGVGTKEINDGLFELVSNGYNVKQAIGMMPELLKTMTANSDDTGLSIKLTSSLLEQFGLNIGSNKTVIDNGNRAMNEMTEVAHRTALKLDNLQVVSANAGSAMHGMGIKTNEFLAIAGKLKSAGQEDSAIGTGLSSMMTRIATGTGQAAGDLKKYNIQVYDSHHKMKSMLDIVGQMQKAYKGMNGEEQAKFKFDVFGQENMKLGSTLMKAHLDQYRKLSNEIKNSTGTVDKYNNTMSKTNKYAVQQLKSSIQDLSIAIGQKLLPSLTPIIKKFTQLINSFSKMNPQTKDFIVKAALITAVLGPVLMLIGQIASGIGAVISVLSFLAANPIVLIIAALAAIGVGIYEAYKHIKPFHDAVNNMFKSVANFFKGIGKWFSKLPGQMKSAFNGMNKWFSQIPKKIKSSFSGIGKTGSKIGSYFSKIWQNISKETSKWISGFAKIGQKMLKAILGAFKGFGKFLFYALAIPVGLMVLITKPLVEPLKNIMKSLINSIKKIWTPIIKFLVDIFIKVFNGWKNILTRIFNFLRDIFTKYINYIQGVMNLIVKVWNTSWTKISNFFRPILLGISNFFTSTFSSIKSFFIGVMNALSNITSSVLGTISTIWNTSIKGISDFFKSIMKGIVNFANPIMNSLSNIITNSLTAISSTWSNMWNGMASFFSGIWKGIKDAAADGINGVIGVINSGVDAIDSVWKFFTGKKTSVPHLGKVHFEQGGVVEQHLSVINDGKGSNWKELVQLPSGKLMMSHQRNWTGMLPAGTRIYNGDETKAIMSTAGVQHYATGGIVGKIEGAGSNVIDWTKGSLDNISSWLGDKFDVVSKFMEHPIENTKVLMTNAGNKVMPKVEAYADFAKGALDKTASKAGEWVKDHIQGVMDKMMESMGGSGGAMPAKAYGPMIRAAAAYMHQSINDFNVDMIERIIGNESGGNPHAINLWDSNAQKGTPSKGILQYIDPTFRNYAMPGHTNIWNPLDQLIALFNDATWRSDMGMGYNGKYGEWRGSASGPSGPRLMAAGGLITRATKAIVGEAGPEVVLPLTNKTRAMQILSEAQAKFGDGISSMSGNVDTSIIEQNQKQQSLMMEIQNKILSKILQILDSKDETSSSQNGLNSLYQMMDKLGLKDRKLTKYQMG